MRTLALAALAALAQSTLADTTIGLNFCDHWENPHVSDGTADGFSGWVDSRAIGDTTDPAVQSAPLALGTSGVSVTWTSSNIWPAGAEGNNEQALYRVYLDDGQTSTGVGVRVTITGLSGWLTRTGNASYRLRCYANNDGANTFQPISVRNGATTASPVLQSITPLAKGNGNYPTSGTLGTGESRGYGDSPSDLTADTITLTVPPRSGSSRGTLCAFRITALGTPPVAATLAATGVTDTTAVLNGTVNASGLTTAVTFEYGLTLSYGSTVAAVPATVTSTTGMAVSAVLADLAANTTYHYRVAATSTAGTTYGLDRTFATGKAVFLAGLTPSAGTLTPAFSKTVMSYVVQVPFATTSIRVTPVAEDAGSTIQVQGTPVASGATSEPIALAVGNTAITAAVTAAGGTFARNYVVTVTRLPAAYAFDSADSVPITATAFDATGKVAVFALNYAPAVGTNLTVVRNTGLAFIQGNFSNLAQGQRVDLTHNGIVYRFVANYYGGSGNDLVLQWGNVRLLAWGSNYTGQLGNGTSSIGNNGLVPTAVNAARVLAGKSVMAVACGGSHSLAVCTDGTLAAWGAQQYGQLGNGATSLQDMLEPVLVNRSGVLAGKTVVAVAAGGRHSVALCSDGTVAAWGENEYGQIGDGSAGWLGSTPAAVSRAGALAGRTVVAIAAGANHNLALCADGALVAWGGSGGELGDGSTGSSRVPVLVDRSGVLAGKTVVAIAANGGSNFALCADGFLAAWGWNGYGQLGNGTKINSTVPVAVAMTGALSGKTIRSVAVSSEASYALCSDGSLAAWGHNDHSELGNNSTTDSLTPVAVLRSGALASKTITGIVAGAWGGAMAICADGSIANWGENTSGQLGNNSTTSSLVPVLVSTAGLEAGERFAQGTVIARNGHSLALAAEVPPPLATTLAATEIHDNGATLNATAGANGGSATFMFEYGLTTAYGMTAQASPVAASGTTVTAVSAEISDLPAGTTFHFRVVVTGTQGVTSGEDQSFTTTALATLASLTASAGQLNPVFAPTMNAYTATVPSTVESLALTPVASLPDAIVTVDGAPVASGTASPALDLTEGDNPITVTVTTVDGNHLGTYAVMVTRVPRAVRFTAPGMVGVTVAELTATGGEIGLELAYAPVPGACLTVVDHTGLNPISGVFDNLAHGQEVELPYGGTRYRFVANYYGGSGNDLVLQWANTRIFGWGDNGSGQLGNNRMVGSLVPVLADHTGVLAGKVVTAISAAKSHSLALCADGTLAAWGDNTDGQLGNGTIIASSAPVLVSRAGVLAGKTVIAVTTGDAHNLALCSDGTLAAWGNNYRGQLGIPNSNIWSTVPVLVDRTGVLAGRTIVAVAASGDHCLALCADGAVAAWGCNYHGQLGNGTTTDSKVPVLVDRTGVLLGKSVIAIGAGGGDTTMPSQSALSLALCSDGTLASWGAGGLLGDGGSLTAKVPVLVDRSGVLAGKTVSAINAGRYVSMALGADGQVAAWGNNYYGQLGNNSTISAPAPVLVSRAGVLAGKTVASVSGGGTHSLACCTDGSMVAWGGNSSGNLGNNGTTNSLVPVLVNTSNLPAGSRSMKIAAGFYHNQALVGMPPPPIATTLAADEITDSTATLRASANANGGSASLAFEYGLTETYGSTVTATPASVTGSTATAMSAPLGDLVPGATYHFRLVATGAGGAARGEDRVFTTSTLATFASLGLSSGALTPDFSSGVTRYGVVVPNATSRIALTPVAANPAAEVRVNGVEVSSGTASEWIDLAVGNNDITCNVNASDENALTYTVTVTRLPETYTFSSAGAVPVTVGDFTATGNSANFALAYAPVAGTTLMVVKTTGMNPIRGIFDNLAQGQVVKLSYAGVTYSFVANYFGGTGNDLVLLWGHTRLAAWGYNNYSTIGNGMAETYSLKPVPVDMTGVLAGKTVTTMTSRNGRVLALCADGTLANWGLLRSSPVVQEARPVAVPLTGALSAKTVVAIATGYLHSLALCSDGTLAAWGNNTYGSLGDGSTTPSTIPVLVNREGVLNGKTVIAVAAHAAHSFALCSDGTVAAWGRNEFGTLGNGATADSPVPVLVDRSGALAGKVVTSIASGTAHALALCSDGTVAAWGKNTSGELGNNGLGANNRPVLVDRTGVLSGRIVTAVSAGSSHSLALCADGTLAAWGNNEYGMLGDNTTTNAMVPVLTNRSGVLASKTIADIFAGGTSSMVWCTDGSIAAWGYNYWGDVGDNTQNTRAVPVLVDASILKTSERFAPLKNTAATYALVAAPPPPQATTLAATGVSDTGATLQANVAANGTSTAVSFEYGLTSTYGSTVAATPSTVTGTAVTAASAVIGNLLPGTTYHYRITATSPYGTTLGEDLTFTTTAFCTLASLALSDGTLTPGFSSLIPSYIATVPFDVTSVKVTPVTVFATSTVMVNNVAVTSGVASDPVPLSVGNNPITTRITADDGVNTKSYGVTVTRLPAVFTFNSAASVPVTAAGFAATGNAASFALNYTPAVGTNLTIVNNTGGAPIQGVFGNLAQGQRVSLTYNGAVYPFVANYFGGTGNDLVLQWANTRLLAWGDNSSGELGNGTKTDSHIPTAVDMSGALAGRTILAGSTGNSHSLVYDVTGAAASWGGDPSGQLGIGNSEYSGFRATPVWVSTAGVLGTKTVTGIAAGGAHSLVRCSDGSMAAWGANTNGEVGNTAATYSRQSTPFPVDHSGVLAGKSVIEVATGMFHSVALCGDGSVAVWGDNYFTQLGNNTDSNGDKRVPVLVNGFGALVGKQVKAIAAGHMHTLALCTDGKLVTWGRNENGELGNNSTTSLRIPVAVTQTGVLAGKTITAMAVSGGYSIAGAGSLVLCSDGTLAAWGSNYHGQLGNGSNLDSTVPVLVNRTGVLAGKNVIAIAAGAAHYLALCSDGTLAAWGYNGDGQLGNNSLTNSTVPVLVNTTALRTGERITGVIAGADASQSLAIVASPPLPTVTTLPVIAITPTTATLKGTVNAAGGSVAVSFEYGLTTAYGSTGAAAPGTVTGTATATVSRPLVGLAAGATYHYRVIATGPNGTTYGDGMTFTASNPPAFTGYAVTTPWQTVATLPLRKILAKASDADGDLIAVTAAGPASAQGGTAVLQGSGILYTPRAGFSGTDTFPVTLTDAGGASVVGAVTVTVGLPPSAGGVGLNPAVLTPLPGGKMGLAFHGIPGRSYVVQRSVNGLDNWATLATVVADASGNVSFTDEAPPAGSAFYRLGLP